MNSLGAGTDRDAQFAATNREPMALLIDVATAARAFLKAHGIVEEWENAYDEAEALETALAEWEERLRVG